MAKHISAARAKAHLSDLVAQVAYGGEHFVIERRGRPLAALVSIADLDQLEAAPDRIVRPLGALGLVGLLADIEDDEIEAVTRQIYTTREQDTGRPVDLAD